MPFKKVLYEKTIEEYAQNITLPICLTSSCSSPTKMPYHDKLKYTVCSCDICLACIIILYIISLRNKNHAVFNHELENTLKDVKIHEVTRFYDFSCYFLDKTYVSEV